MSVRDELLAKSKSKITAEEFHDYVAKHHTFYSGLSKTQQAFYKEKNKKTLKEFLGREVTEDDIKNLLKETHGDHIMMGISCCTDT
jgi:hypothetical protein